MKNQGRVMAMVVVAFAAVTSSMLWCEEKAPAMPINIEADAARYEGVTQQQIYEGNVVLIQGKNEIHADKILVTNSNSPALVAVATGDPVKFRVFNEKKARWVDGTAKQVEFHNQNQNLVLKGEAYVNSDGDVARGTEITYDLKQDSFILKGGTQKDKERVRIIVDPKNWKKPQQQ